MCGLWGILGPGISSDDLVALEELAYISGLRGSDGTGILQAKGKGKKDILIEKFKHDVNYFKFYHRYMKTGNKNVFSNVTNYLFAGHVRAATKGDISDENTHPFECNHLIGMHNGTLKDKKYQDNKKTDSELFIRDISENGITEVIRELHVDSAFAIVLFDKQTELVHFVRNSKREIHFCFNDKRAVMYWASEAWMLRGILGRNGLKIKDNIIWNLTPNVVYTINPKKYFLNDKSPFIKEEIFLEEEKKEEKVVQVNTNNVVPLITQAPTPNKIVQNSNSKIPAVFCCSCTKPMNLLDRYFGNKLSQNSSVYICKECEDNIPNFLTRH